MDIPSDSFTISACFVHVKSALNPLNYNLSIGNTVLPGTQDLQ